MPPQHVEVAETIAALKRAIRREKEAPTDQTISSATNRGNKLKRGAGYVHAGALPYPHGPDGYKEKIEHAGYSRYILDRNPKRYNEYGDELEASESDTEADADAEDENPYAGIRLEELLCPLKHPSDLASHPTLSLPFLDSALPDMVRSVEDKLRQARANLWRAKNLNRQFMGDEPWMPCGSIEGLEDWDMFEPKPRFPTQQAGKKRKREHANEIPQNGVNGHNYAKEDETSTEPPRHTVEANAELTSEMQSTKNAKPEEETGSVIEASTKEQPEMKDNVPTANGGYSGNQVEDSGENKDQLAATNSAQNQKAQNGEKMDIDADENEDNTASDEETQQQPTRRITRALAAGNNPSDAASPPLSPQSTTSTIDSSLLQPDPLFLLPPTISANHRLPNSLSRLGLPVEEFLETRRLLSMYIQKQEESVRGYEAVLGKLIKAKRMRDKVWEWSKTEGHVGEWSDGEDWIDAEAWGLTPEELKKGKDEEEVEGQEDTGRKGKRRRRD
ncbi:hypothetical protein PV05_08032 [Exophiala xenobiotica]|uniref:Transcriptional regulatory protein RXT2 N-terminal domain-containing protein n=1 Tax=Exophiala xenobiotica TaxID=348802 RepID=A0A0D2CQW5_9EURO|nr:uncharacterized protein PV05_08032 [Exophiala xenobiotica]KIW52392.1 hypothetical protein PV05_08032 [Exophiala xenobiotica]